MSVEAIAEVVADIRAGRVKSLREPDEVDMHRIDRRLLERAQLSQPVVDCTAINAEVKRQETIHLYDDHPQIVPPWVDALLCYVNSYGNVLVLQVHRTDWSGEEHGMPPGWHTANEVDWPRVRWLVETTIWLGGRSQSRYLPTAGPCHMFRHALNEDGSPADIAWVALMYPADREIEARTDPVDMTVEFGFPLDTQSHRGVPVGYDHEMTWGAPLVTVGAALNFLNAANVDIAEPARPRATRRRLDRTGVIVQTIVVRPPGKRRAKTGAARPLDAAESILSPVRGHWARYGPQFNRGLLFGKLEGKFWISGYVRGAGLGDEEPVRDYALKPKVQP